MTPDHVIAANEYGRYCVPKSSQERPAAKAILAGKVWEGKTISLMAANCGDGDIVHAGTYFGDFLPGLSHALKLDARLWAFEPSEENHVCAERTIALNNLNNVNLMRAGLSARTGTASLHTNLANGRALGGRSTIVKAPRGRQRYETVPLVALDDVVPKDRSVSIIQLDVEGHEQKALRGALKTLARCRPLLVLETLPENAGFLREHVFVLGYRNVGNVHGNTVLTASDMLPLEFDACCTAPENPSRDDGL